MSASTTITSAPEATQAEALKAWIWRSTDAHVIFGDLNQLAKIAAGPTPDCGPHCNTSGFNDSHCSCKQCHGKPW